MSGLARANLAQGMTRTLISIVAVAFEVAMVLVLVGMANGTLGEFGDRMENLQSDIMLLPPGGQIMISFSSAVMPRAPVQKALLATPGIAEATPVVIANTDKFGSLSMIWGIDPESYNRTGRGMRLVRGEMFSAPDDLIIDTRLARAENLSVGDKVEMLNSRFQVSGICEEGTGVRMYLPIDTVEELSGRPNRASLFFIKTSEPAETASVVERLLRSTRPSRERRSRRRARGG